jgi:putative inorganic carbon (HCO3(-)) transporter
LGSARSLPSSQRFFHQAAFWSACGSALAILFSIAASQILMGVAILAILLARDRIRLPRPWLPLALFLLGTMISLLASGHMHDGLPQVRKLYVYLILVVMFTVLRNTADARNLMLAWCAAAGIGSVIGIVQFGAKWRAAQDLHRDFYEYYLNARITGTMGHWMTFSGEEMLVLVVLASFLLFARSMDKRIFAAGWVLAATLCAALILSDTRSVWIAVFCALLYLTWCYRKVLVLAIPVLALIGYALAPGSIKERVDSIAHPHGTTDSNDFRFIVWRTGVHIIEAHPWLGLGPEEVHQQFYQWLPADIPRPLPPGYYGHLHSIYIHYAAERGIPTTLMLMWMLGMILWDAHRALRELPAGRGDIRFLLHAGVGCVLAIMVEGFFELNLGDSEVLTMFLVVTACTYVAIGAAKHYTLMGEPD